MDEFQDTLARARQGDEAAWRWIITKWHNHLLKRANRYLRHEDDANDAVSEFLIHMVQKQLLQKFRGSTVLEFNAYLNTSMLNLLRNRKKMVELPMQSEIDELVVYDDPVLSYDTRENMKVIKDTIAELPLTYRSIIELEIRQYRHKDIAMILQMPMNTVSSYSRRAKELLQKLLKGKGLNVVAVLLTVLPLCFL